MATHGIEGDTDTRRARRGRDHARHRGDRTGEPFERSFQALGSLAYANARVSASAADLDTGQVLLAIDDGVSLPTAQLGNLLLLIEVAARLGQGACLPSTRCRATPEPAIPPRSTTSPSAGSGRLC